MAGASKNSRTTVATQKFECPECGGEIVMKTLYENGRLRNVAECSKCKLTKRRPKDFRKYIPYNDHINPAGQSTRLCGIFFVLKHIENRTN